MSTARTARLSGQQTAGELERALLAMELDRHSGDLVRAAGFGQAADRLNRPDLAARARLVTADVHCRAGDLATAATTLDEVAAWADAENQPYIRARAHFLLSILHTCIGHLADARRHALLAVDHLPADAPPLIRGYHLVVLALTLDTVADKDAVHYHAEALDIAVAAGNHEMTRGVLNNMAHAAAQAGDKERASALVKRMRALVARTGVVLRPPDLDTIARVALLRDDPAEAERLLMPLVEDSGVHTEGNMLPEILLTLAEARRHQAAYLDAQHDLDRCRLLCAERGLTEVAARARKEQARLYAARGEYRAAYEEYGHYDDEVTALRNAERETQAQLTQLVFEAREGRRDTERFRDMALRDALTGLYNRRFIDGQLPCLIERAVQDGTPLSAAIIDVDFFKRVNDTLSHEVGDIVLQRVAMVLSGAIVEPGTVARIGGEEFVFLLPATAQADAEVLCEQARHAVQDHDWSDLAADLAVTVSIGLTTALRGTTSASALLSQADRNLYAAKRSGRNRVFGDPA